MPIALRTDFNTQTVRAAAKRSKDGPQARRLLALAAGYEGARRTEAAVHGVVRWRIVDLCQWIYEEFRVVVAKPTLSRELRAMGYRKLSARPRHHAQAAGAIEDFKKAFPRAWKRSGAKGASNPAR
jgi:hypothetical protein